MVSVEKTMTTAITALTPDILNDARSAGEWQVAQLKLSGNTDEGLRRSLTQKGLGRAHEFSWERSVRRIRDVYLEVGSRG